MGGPKSKALEAKGSVLANFDTMDNYDVAAAFSRPMSTAVPLARWERKQKENGPGVYDRFITSHSSDSLSLHDIEHTVFTGEDKFGSLLAQSLFEDSALDSRILACKNKAPKPTEFFHNDLRVLYTANKLTPAVKRTRRFIPTAPERTLDAPNMSFDYYLNLLDWSSQNKLAIALGSSLYIWNPENGQSHELFEAPDNEYLCSVSWMEDGGVVALGMSNGDVLLWNAEQKKQVRCMKGHAARTSSLAWKGPLLSSGSRDSNIFNHDVRVRDHCVATLKGHRQEVCKLTWSLDGTQLASGGNDDVCCIWDADSTAQPRFAFTDAQACVKALAWSPHDEHVLATGAGAADHCIRFYDTQLGVLQNCVDTGSQVCSLLWNKHDREILSSHGFSQHEMILWKTPSMVKVAELRGHNDRVLHTALSADGTTVASASPDESLRFWKVFEPAKKVKKPAESPSLLRQTLR